MKEDGAGRVDSTRPEFRLFNLAPPPLLADSDKKSIPCDDHKIQIPRAISQSRNKY